MPELIRSWNYFGPFRSPSAWLVIFAFVLAGSLGCPLWTGQAWVLLLWSCPAVAQCLRGPFPGSFCCRARGPGREREPRLKVEHVWYSPSIENKAPNSDFDFASWYCLMFRFSGGVDGGSLRVWWCLASALMALAYRTGQVHCDWWLFQNYLCK